MYVPLVGNWADEVWSMVKEICDAQELFFDYRI